MGIRVKHVVVVSLIFGVIGFVYELGFGEIDVEASPRARALSATPTSERLVGNLRSALMKKQIEEAMRIGDQLVDLYPQSAGSHLHRGMAYRVGGKDGEGFSSWGMLLAIVGQRSFDELRGWELEQSLYGRGWGYLGVGEVELGRRDFVDLAQRVEEELGDREDPIRAYNLACYWSMGGDVDRALGWWEKSVEWGYLLRDGAMEDRWWSVDPDLELVRGEAWFWELVRIGWDEGVEGGEGG